MRLGGDNFRATRRFGEDGDGFRTTRRFGGGGDGFRATRRFGGDGFRVTGRRFGGGGGGGMRALLFLVGGCLRGRPGPFAVDRERVLIFWSFISLPEFVGDCCIIDVIVLWLWYLCIVETIDRRNMPT